MKNRDNNFELLRIILMNMIVVLHFNLHGKVLGNIPIYSNSYYLFFYLECASMVAVNCYVLISGYYMINSKVKIKKIILLWIQVMMYSVVLYMCLILFTDRNFEISELVKAFFPIINSQYWFISVYFGLYILTPFLNKLLKSLNKEQYISLLIISTFLLVIIEQFNPNNNLFFGNNGNSLIWFVYLYSIAGYIRLYYKKQQSPLIFLLIFIIITLINTSYNILGQYKDFNTNIISNNSILVLLETISIFLLFKNIKISNNIVNKIIGKISPLVLGVYLIHDSNFWREVMESDIE